MRLFFCLVTPITYPSCQPRYFRDMKLPLLSLVALLSAHIAFAQPFNYEIHLEPVSIDNLDGTHSYAFGQHNGKWLIIGGRKDGLHARQPFNAFPEALNNKEMMVVDPISKQVWSANMTELNQSISEQLQSTNMCFHQIEDTLYIAGGYAYSASQADHITFPYLTTIIVSQTIDAVIHNQSKTSFIKQNEDVRMAVTGGHLAEMDNELVLVGGHKFDGRYNPMGHNTYVQTYTNAVRSFMVNNSNNNPVIHSFSEIIDGVNLHRRDYNLIPQIFPDGAKGYTISSGVFQVNVDLPYLYPVDISPNGINARTSFNQYLSNYHSASATLYDTVNQINHSLFFGGMSQYYYANGTLMQDDQVPFVKTISRVSRDATDQLTEYNLPIEMPNLQGAGSEFIPVESLLMNDHDIIPIGETSDDSIMIGYIYGGIKSSSTNPFSNNTTAQTSADESVFEVWLIPTNTLGDQQVNGRHGFNTELFPNPSDGKVNVRITSPASGKGAILVMDAQGRIIHDLVINVIHKGENEVQLFEAGALSKGVYYLSFSLDDKYFDQSSLIIE